MPESLPPGSCIVESEHSDCFKELTDYESDLLQKNTINIEFKKGEIVAKQGSFASHIIYLKTGLAKIYLSGGSKDLILKITPEKRFIGLSSIFEGNNKFIYSASTYVDSEASLIDKEFFKSLIRNNSKFASNIISIQNENAAQVYSRFYSLTHKQSNGLVADLLMCLSNRVFKSTKFCLPLSRSDLADLVGLSVESVLRILKDFKEEGIIETRGKHIIINQPEALDKISIYG
ncbi:MAG: Crp/Fnr family transcriptional regulator [Chlorobi bacterium]|nr:Crp/Fnr family transcriptional regulator [Chlorobiota bacterium]